jgi:putative chitinase
MNMQSPPRKPVLPTAALLGRLGAAQPQMWAPILATHCAAHAIDTPARLARFLGNTLHQADGFARLVEDLNYSAKRLTEVWPARFPTLAAAKPFARNAQALAERVYGGRMGNLNPFDGFHFRGRGLMQTTGRDNYARLAVATGRALESLPDWIETPEGAAESAARFWAWAGCNALADAGEDAALRRRINGGEIGLADVVRRSTLALNLIESGKT